MVKYLATLVGVRFHRAGKLVYCESINLELIPGDRVIVDANDCPQIGWIVIGSGQVVYSEVEGPLQSVLRKATDQDCL